MTTPGPMVDVLHQMAVSLPASQMELLAGVLDASERPGVESRQAASALVASPRFKEAVADLWSEWEGEPEVTGAALALAVRTAAHTAERLRAASSLEVVWTGPASPFVPVRFSAQILESLIDAARQRLIIVSFAAYRVAQVESALVDAAGRGVTIDLVLETSSDAKGQLDHDAAHAFNALAGVARFWVWPGDMRPLNGALLHAKAAIQDTTAALVTSANFTGRALNSNMELGLLASGGPVPRRLADHFDALMSTGVLVQL